MCDQALLIEPNNVKALYFSAKSQYELDDFEEACKRWKALIEIDPNNKEAREGYEKSKNAKNHARDKETSIYSKMFS
jgi:cytochrome c-type biogenesis protein CcmH/NrfG